MMNLRLDSSSQRFVREMVESGRFANESDVIEEALQMMRRQQQEDAAYQAYLRREIQIGIDEADRGEFVEFTAEDIIREGRKRLPDGDSRARSQPE